MVRKPHLLSWQTTIYIKRLLVQFQLVDSLPVVINLQYKVLTL